MFDYQIKRAKARAKWKKKAANNLKSSEYLSNVEQPIKTFQLSAIAKRRLEHHKNQIRHKQQEQLEKLQLQEAWRCISWMILHGVKFF